MAKAEVRGICQDEPLLALKLEGHRKRASLVAQLVKNPLAMQETPVQVLGREDLLEKA